MSFDRSAESYEELIRRSISFSGVEHGFFLDAKARTLHELVGDPGSLRALDVGCGAGGMHDYLRFGELHAVDPSDALIADAQARGRDVRYAVGDGTALPYDDGSFDVAFTVCVLHHVEPAARARFAAELARVTKPGGRVIVFEHNPLNPLTRLAVARCAFDEDAVLLGRRESLSLLRSAGLGDVRGGYFLFFPVHALRALERRLTWLPLGAQYYAVARR